MKRIRKRQSHRYYCQNCIKPPIKVDGRAKTLDIPYPDFASIPMEDGQRYYVGHLIQYGYLAQYKLLEVEAKHQEPATPAIKKARVKKPAIKKDKPVRQLKQLNLF